MSSFYRPLSRLVPLAHAQIVNTQPLLTPGNKQGLHLELGVSLELSRGNVDLIVAKGLRLPAR